MKTTVMTCDACGVKMELPFQITLPITSDAWVLADLKIRKPAVGEALDVCQRCVTAAMVKWVEAQHRGARLQGVSKAGGADTGETGGDAVIIDVSRNPTHAMKVAGTRAMSNACACGVARDGIAERVYKAMLDARPR